MRTIEIEDDVYEYLRQHTVQIGESADQILRRLLGIPIDDIRTDIPVEISDTELSECLDDDLITKRTVVGKFLYIISYVYKRDPEQFKKVLEISGRHRKYFALSRKELDDSGSCVNPQQIPDSPYWVITNNDTPWKRRRLHEVLKLLGYSDQAVKEALGALT